MRILIATVVHHCEDARIRHRQIPALLEQGWEVTYLAPGGDTTPAPEGLTRVELPRAVGRDRLAALVAARRELGRLSRSADLTVVHDPELLLVTNAVRSPLIWDIHEDLAAQMVDKSWIPGPLRPLAAGAGGLLERRGRRLHRTIAEVAYQDRHPDAVLVRNTVDVPLTVPPTTDDRLVYLGRVSRGRGAAVLRDVALRLPTGTTLDVIGQLDADIASLFEGIEGASARGFLPNNLALRAAQGATAGVALLRDLPNYRHSMPTKIFEYLAQGVPVITTPLPIAVAFVERHDCGIIVPFDDPDAVLDAFDQLRGDPDRRARLAENGRRAVAVHYNWREDAGRMIEYYQAVADGRA